MRILAIGLSLNKKLATSTYFASAISFLDYDLVICDLSAALKDYYHQWSNSSTYMGYPNLDDDNSVRLIQDILRRRAEMIELLKLGRMLVIFTPPPTLCYVATGEKQTSGTGRNARTTRIVTQANILNCLPIEVSTTQASGESVEFRGNEPFRSFWIANKDNFVYEAYLNKTFGQPIFYITNTDRVIGTYQAIYNGHLLLIPSLASMNEATYKNATNTFVQSITVLYEELKKQTGDFELPSWTYEYALPREEAENKKLKTLEYELSQILTKVAQQKEKLQRLS